MPPSPNDAPAPARWKRWTLSGVDALWGAAIVAAFAALLIGWGGATERSLSISALAILAGCGIAALRYALAMALRKESPRLPDLPVAALVAIGLFLVWSLLQVCPLPESLLASLSPQAARWRGVQLAMAGLPPTLSVDPAASWTAIHEFALWLASALLFAAWSANPKRRDWLAGALVVMGCASLAIGVWRLAGPTQTPGAVRHYAGPFVNRNHFAGMMAMLAPLAAGFATTLAARARARAERKLRVMTLGDALSSRLFPFLIAPAAFVGATLLSLSRSGALAASVAMGVWMALAARGQGARRAAGAATFAMALAAISVLLLGLEPLARRFEQIGAELDPASAGTRARIWADTFRMAVDFGWVGGGPGSFYGLWLPYSSLPTAVVPVHAHNDWLQLWVESGGVGFFLLASALALFAAFSWRRCRATAESAEGPIFAGCLAAIAGIATQSFGDFSLRMPLNALTLAAIVGLLLGSAERRGEGRRHRGSSRHARGSGKEEGLTTERHG